MGPESDKNIEPFRSVFLIRQISRPFEMRIVSAQTLVDKWVENSI